MEIRAQGARFNAEERAKAAARLQQAFERSRNPMLIVDDQRCWITGNDAAADLLGIARTAIPWRRMDEFTPPSERQRFEEQWEAFLAGGVAEGWFELSVPKKGLVPVEFSATANVLPRRHLSVLIPTDKAAVEQVGRGASLKLTPKPSGSAELTEREREVIALIASGFHNQEMAARLFLSPETIKSHVQHAMEKLGVHTRAHAVALALVTGQITWDAVETPTPTQASRDWPVAG